MYYKLWLYASVTSRSKRMKGRGEEGHGNRLRVFSPLPSSLLSSPLLPSPTSPLPLTTLLSSALLLSPPLSSSLLFSPPLPCPLLYSPLLSSPLNSLTLLYSPLLPCPLLSSLLVLILFYLLSNIGFLIAGVSLLISSIIPSLPVPILCTPSLRGRR